MNTNNYLPFDLETALKHPERVVTRDGRKVEQLHLFKRQGENTHPLYGIIDDDVEHWNTNGNYLRTVPSNSDLFLLPEVKECWVNVYQMGKMIILGSSMETELLATSNILSVTNLGYTYIKTIRITNEPE